MGLKSFLKRIPRYRVVYIPKGMTRGEKLFDTAGKKLDHDDFVVLHAFYFPADTKQRVLVHRGIAEYFKVERTVGNK